jgi:hypothetical protein
VTTASEFGLGMAKFSLISKQEQTVSGAERASIIFHSEGTSNMVNMGAIQFRVY